MGEAKCQLFIEAPPPRILSDLVDQTVIEGSDFTLEIKAIGEIAEYAWFKDGIIIKPCEEFQMGRDTEKIWLKIASSLLKDSGAYSVSISNGVDIMESSCNVTIELKQEQALQCIEQKPQLTKKLQGIVKVVEGSTIKLEVELLKTPITKCTWFKSGTPIEHSDKFQVWHEDASTKPVQSVLIIMNLTLDDAAEYTYRASNELGECATSATIIVQPLKKITKEKGKQPMRGPEDDAQGDKKSITGKQNQPGEQKPLFTSVKTPVQGKRASFFQDSLTNMNIDEEMEGCLVCHIQEPWLGQEKGPKYFICYYNDQKINEGNEFILKKNESGYQCRFFKTKDENVEVVYNTEIGQVKIIIKESSRAYSGQYKLIGLNDDGDYDTTSGNLNVIRSEAVPDLIPETIIPQIFGQIHPVTAHEKIHDDISLEVQFQENPKPQTNWSYKGVPLASNVKYDIVTEKESSKLTIREPVPEDEGDYTFTTTSEFGTNERTGRLTVIPAPPPPAPPVAKDKTGRPKIKRGTIPSMEYMLEWSSFEEEDEPEPVPKVIYRSPPDDFVPVD